MTIQIPFLKRLNKDYLKQYYATFYIQILAIKSNFKFIILFFRIESSSKKEGKYELFESFDQEAIIMEEFITADRFLERIKTVEGETIYDLGDIKFNFAKQISFPQNYADFLRKVNTGKQKYLSIRVRDPINFIYFQNLYNMKSTPKNSSINNHDYSFFEKSGILSKTHSFYEKKFVLKNNLYLGRDILEKYYSSDFRAWLEPKLLIILPIKTLRVSFEYQKRNSTTFINVSFKIPKDWENISKIICIKGNRLLPIKDSKVNIKIEKNFSNFVDITILWNGQEELISKNTRLYWRQMNFYEFNEINEEEIKEFEEKEVRLNQLIEEERVPEEIVKNLEDLGEINRQLLIRYESLHNNGVYDYMRKIQQLKDNRIKIYEKLLKKIGDFDQYYRINYHHYLMYNNILFQKYEELLDEKEKLYLNDVDKYFQISDITEIEGMFLSLRLSRKVVIEEINKIQLENVLSLISFLEILGDLYLHYGLLNMIISAKPLVKTRQDFSFKHAIESYQKALHRVEEISIPGVQRGSIHVKGYMKIFNKFISQGGLQSKIEDIQTLIRTDFRNYNKKMIVLFDTPNQSHFLKTSFFEGRLRRINEFIESFSKLNDKIIKFAFVNEQSLKESKSGIGFLEQDVDYTLIYTLKVDKKEDVPKRTDVDPKLTSMLYLLASLTSNGWDIIFLITRDKGLIQSILKISPKQLVVIIQPEDKSLDSATYLKKYKAEGYAEDFQVYTSI